MIVPFFWYDYIENNVLSILGLIEMVLDQSSFRNQERL